MDIKKLCNAFPHTFVVLFIVVALVTIGTYVIPAGVYDRVEDAATHRMVVNPATFHAVEQTPVGIFQMFMNLYKGMYDAGNIIFFVMISYACFYLIIVSGALNSAIGALLRVAKGKEAYILPIFVYVFATFSTFFGMFEEAFGFIPVFAGLAIALGYDAIVGLSVVAMGCGMGFSAAFMNPFTVGLAQKLAELPLFSGMQFRIVSWFVFVTMGVIWMTVYGAKVKKDPSKSLVAGVDMGALELDPKVLEGSKMSGKHALTLLILVGMIAILIWGVTQKGWYFDELCALLLITGILAGFANGYGPSRICEIFGDAFKEMASTACVIGISRAVLLVMKDGQIIDSVVNGLAAPLSAYPAWVGAQGMLFVQTIISFLIPSGSGMAVVTMPIMAPLADILGISRQVAVLCFQYGDGFSNVLWPTTLLPVMCGLAKVPVVRWWQYFVPFFCILYVVQMVFVAVAVMTGYN